MPLRKSAAAIRRKIEDAQRDQLERGLPAGAIRDQVPAATLPPGGNTGSGYTPSPHTHPLTDLEQGGATDGQVVTWSDGDSAFVPADPTGGGGSLDVTDGTTTVSPTTTIVFPAGTITDNGGGEAEYTPAGGGGGGATISTGAYGSEPGSPAAGDLYLPNNAPLLERSTGSVWVPWGPIFPLTPPPSSGWSWTNQGGASLSTANGGITLIDPASNSIDYRVYKRTAPSTPYTITVAFLAPRIAQDYMSCGIGWRESGSGKLALVRTLFASGAFLLAPVKCDSATSDNSAYANVTIAMPTLIWLRIADTGANRTIEYGVDGQNWTLIHTVGNTDFITADQVCLFVSSRNATYPISMAVLSWKEA